MFKEFKHTRHTDYNELIVFKHLKVKCKLCHKPLPRTGKKLICYQCYNELIFTSCKSSKIKSLRNKVRKMVVFNCNSDYTSTINSADNEQSNN